MSERAAGAIVIDAGAAPDVCSATSSTASLADSLTGLTPAERADGPGVQLVHPRRRAAAGAAAAVRAGTPMTTVFNRLGPYEIVQPIGSGGMAQVFLALDTRSQRSRRAAARAARPRPRGAGDSRGRAMGRAAAAGVLRRLPARTARLRARRAAGLLLRRDGISRRREPVRRDRPRPADAGARRRRSPSSCAGSSRRRTASRSPSRAGRCARCCTAT